MLRRVLRGLRRISRNLVILSALVLLLPRTITTIYALPRLNSIADTTQTQVAIVYGAALTRHGTPSAVLRDRVRTATELYHAGKVSKLLMSGQSPEPLAMQEYAVELGVPAEDILLDDGGLRTYDTCYRAKQVFGLEDAVLVTQAYHLPRALYLCSHMGVNSEGVAAHESRYWRGAMFFWQVRETLATVVALWEVHITKPIPTFAEIINLMEEL